MKRSENFHFRSVAKRVAMQVLQAEHSTILAVIRHYPGVGVPFSLTSVYNAGGAAYYAQPVNLDAGPLALARYAGYRHCETFEHEQWHVWEA